MIYVLVMICFILEAQSMYCIFDDENNFCIMLIITLNHNNCCYFSKSCLLHVIYSLYCEVLSFGSFFATLVHV